MVGDHGVAGVDFIQTRHLAGVNGHVGDIEHVAGAEAVPGILDAVMAEAEVESGLPKFFDAGDAASFGVGIGAALEGDVDEGVGNEVELGFLEEAEEFEGVGVVVGAESGGVAGGGAGAEPPAVGAGSDNFEEAGLVVVDFVAMEVEGAIVLFGEFKDAMDRANAIFAGHLVVGDAADDIGSETKGFFEESFIFRMAVETVLGEGDDLDGDPVTNLVADFEEGLEGGEGWFADIGMGADKEGTLLGLEAEGLEGTVLDIGEGEGPFAIAPDFNALKQRATLVPPGLTGSENRI
jgi:hypothetical protein